MIQSENETFVRLTTEDADLLLPILLASGASFRLGTRGRVEVRGMGAADIASLAVWSRARVTDLEVV